MYRALGELQSPEFLLLFLVTSYIWNDKLCPRTEKFTWEKEILVQWQILDMFIIHKQWVLLVFLSHLLAICIRTNH